MNKMLVGMEDSIGLPLLSVSVDGQTGLFSVRQGRKITPNNFMVYSGLLCI